jgi:hypothetical protein
MHACIHPYIYITYTCRHYYTYADSWIRGMICDSPRSPSAPGKMLTRWVATWVDTESAVPAQLGQMVGGSPAKKKHQTWWFYWNLTSLTINSRSFFMGFHSLVIYVIDFVVFFDQQERELTKQKSGSTQETFEFRSESVIYDIGKLLYFTRLLIHGWVYGTR